MKYKIVYTDLSEDEVDAEDFTMQFNGLIVFYKKKELSEVVATTKSSNKIDNVLTVSLYNMKKFWPVKEENG